MQSLTSIVVADLVALRERGKFYAITGMCVRFVSPLYLGLYSVSHDLLQHLVRWGDPRAPHSGQSVPKGVLALVVLCVDYLVANSGHLQNQISTFHSPA